MILLLATLILFATTCTAQSQVSELPLNVPPVWLYPCAGYCQLSGDEPEAASVKAAICGEHRDSRHYATLRETSKATPSVMGPDGDFLPKALIDSLYRTALTDSLIPPAELAIINAIMQSTLAPAQVFQNAYIEDAQSYIFDKSANFDFVLINEAHHATQHRTFTAALLEGMYHQRGFRYLALEALSRKDTTLSQRGFANIGSGTYTNDPAFGFLIAEALRIGYTVIGYETTRDVDGSARDLDQAENIIQQTKAIDSSAKILVHAGYSHIDECCLHESYVPLGARLKEITGQDIFTINQVNMIDFLDVDKEHPYYSFAVDTLAPEQSSPFIVFDEQGLPILSLLAQHHTDVEVYHPRTQYINGRPTWLVQGRNFYPVPESLRRWEGNLLSIVRANHPDVATPVDQFILQSDEKQMLLNPGQYRARIVDCSGVILANYSMVVR